MLCRGPGKLQHADYSVVYDCNSGAAVLDHEFVSLRMRGGDYHAYQFFIRDQGVIDSLAHSGAVNPDHIISQGHEVAISFTLSQIYNEGR